MAVLQRVALYPNERFDTPDARALEAFGQNDWRFFLQGVMSEKSHVLSGFEISNYAYVFQSGGVKIRLNNAVILHPEAKTQAVGYYVASGSESDANLTLSPSSTNFIEADMSSASGTPDTRAFWDMGADGGKGAEFTDVVDTVINLNLTISSNISGFSDGKIPLYKITTDASGVAVSVTDCRPLFFRLGTGGSSPNPDNQFSWPTDPDSLHSQLETPVKTSGVNQKAPFQGGDKNIKTFKQWMDAIMTSLMKSKASSYWYSPSLSSPEIYQNSSMILLVGGTWQQATGTPGRLNLVAGSTVYRLGKANNASLSAFSNLDLTINKCLFVMLPDDAAVAYGMGQDAATPIVPKQVISVTDSTISVGITGNYMTSGGNIRVRNQVFSYTSYDANTGLFSQVSPDPSGLVKASDYVYQEVNGVNSFYHYGPTALVPGLSGGVSEGVERTMWLAFYDGAGKIHTQNATLDVGEQIQVGNNTSQAIINYIGSTGEADSTPVYNVNSISNGTNLTAAIQKAFQIIEKPIYDEVVTDTAGTGWASGSIIVMPPNTRANNSPAAYTVGTGELQIFDNGIYMRPGYDYTELNNNSIQLLRDVYTGSYIRFRIATIGGAGAASGSAQSGSTLDSVYGNGNIINTTANRPMTVNGPGTGKIAVFNGDVKITGVLDPTAIQFTPVPANPMSAGQIGFWVDNTATLPTLRFARSDGKVVDVQGILDNVSGDSTILTRTMRNDTGATIPAGAPLYISAAGHVDLAYNMSDTAHQFFGIAAASIPTGTSGKVIYTGVVPGIFTGMGFSTGYVWLGSSPGGLQLSVPTDFGAYLIIIGLVDGNDLILQPQTNGRVGA